jgi:hypothetical protein
MRNPADASSTTAPLYDVDWINGRAIEVFFVDRENGTRTGWLAGLVLVDMLSGLPAGRRRIRSVPDKLPCLSRRARQLQMIFSGAAGARRGPLLPHLGADGGALPVVFG